MTRALVAASLLLVTLLASASARVAASSNVVSVVGGSATDAALAREAVERFSVAGLDLPPVVIEFVGPSLEECRGAQARAHLDQDPIEVSVCWGNSFVLLHELAHVWTFKAVAGDQEASFMELRTDVHAWADASDAWENQGREHAANVIAWGLMEVPTVVSRTYPNDRDSLVEAFTLLTGRSPLHTEGGEPTLVDRSAFGSADLRPRSTGR